MRLTVIGCTGSVPGPDSPATCHLLSARDDADPSLEWTIALDLGAGSLGALQRHLDPNDLDAVVVSHLHPDHCLDLAALSVWRAHGPWAPLDEPLPVHAPAGTRDHLARITHEDTETLAFTDLADDATFTVGPFAITPRRVRHPMETYGVRVEAGGSSFAHSADTDTCDALLDLARGVDLFLCEASHLDATERSRGSHLTARRAAEAARDAGARRLLLTHLQPWHDPAATLREARSIVGDAELAEPGCTYPV